MHLVLYIAWNVSRKEMAYIPLDEDTKLKGKAATDVATHNVDIKIIGLVYKIIVRKGNLNSLLFVS